MLHLIVTLDIASLGALGALGAYRICDKRRAIR